MGNAESKRHDETILERCKRLPDVIMLQILSRLDLATLYRCCTAEFCYLFPGIRRLEHGPFPEEWLEPRLNTLYLIQSPGRQFLRHLTGVTRLSIALPCPSYVVDTNMYWFQWEALYGNRQNHYSVYVISGTKKEQEEEYNHNDDLFQEKLRQTVSLASWHGSHCKGILTRVEDLLWPFNDSVKQIVGEDGHGRAVLNCCTSNDAYSPVYSYGNTTAKYGVVYVPSLTFQVNNVPKIDKLRHVWLVFKRDTGVVTVSALQNFIQGGTLVHNGEFDNITTHIIEHPDKVIIAPYGLLNQPPPV